MPEQEALSERITSGCHVQLQGARGAQLNIHKRARKLGAAGKAERLQAQAKLHSLALGRLQVQQHLCVMCSD